MRAREKQSFLKAPWGALAGLVLLGALGWSLLSESFVYGQGHAQRPILTFLAFYGLIWLGLAGAFLLARRHGAPPVGFVILVAIVARLILWPSGLIQENDVYRYVLDGQATLHGDNPYRRAPLVVSELGGESLRRSLQREDAREVVDRIGHSHLRTLYPPGAQFAFAAGAWIGGWRWQGQRALFLLVELGAVLLLVQLMRAVGTSPGWIFLYAWNPLILKEIVNSSHLDILVLFWLAGLLVCLNHRSTAAWVAAAGFCFGMAILSKLFPIVLAPALFVSFRHREQWGAAALLAGAAAATVALGYLPFLGSGMTAVTGSLGTYTAGWNMNQGAFAALEAGLQNRTAAFIAMGLLAALLPLTIRGDSVAVLAERLFASLVICFLLLPAPFPWYAVPLVGLASLRPGGLRGPLTIVLSGAVSLYYLSFLFEYQRFDDMWWIAVRVLEHGLIWVSLVGFLALKRRSFSGEGNLWTLPETPSTVH